MSVDESLVPPMVLVDPINLTLNIDCSAADGPRLSQTSCTLTMTCENEE